MGSKSNLCSPLILRNPLLVKAVPNLAVLVEKTQSNISIPRQTHTTRSSGYPTPIRYLGLFSGKSLAEFETVSQKLVFYSPPAKPPIATPLYLLKSTEFMQCSLNDLSIPPYMIGKSVYLSLCLFALSFLSIHLIVLSHASDILAPK
jgi:hypothetical protein